MSRRGTSLHIQRHQVCYIKVQHALHEMFQYFSGDCWVGNNPKRFFKRTLCLEYLSSGEKRAVRMLVKDQKDNH